MEAGGLELFTELLQRFPNNIHILLEIAKVGNSPKESKFFHPKIVHMLPHWICLID